MCVALIQCYGWRYCSVADCMRDQTVLGLADFEAELDAGWVRYDPVATYACHQKFSANPCGFRFFSFTVPTVLQVLAACDGAVLGQRTTGQSCASVADCTAGSHCVYDNYQCPGTCLTWLGKGAPCSVTSGPRCNFQLGLSCSAGTCRGGGAPGDSCTTAADCRDFWCKSDAGVCLGRAAQGQQCSWLGNSQAPACAAGLWCNDPFSFGTCVPLSSSGEVCFEDRNCQSGLVCLPSDDAGFGFGRCGTPGSTGARCGAQSSKDCAAELFCANTDGGRVCQPLLGLGQACTTALRQCAAGLSCEVSDGGATVCLARRCLGQPCNDGVGTCGEGLCLSGACAPHAPLGGSCTSAAACSSGLCRDGGCAEARCSP